MSRKADERLEDSGQAVLVVPGTLKRSTEGQVSSVASLVVDRDGGGGKGADKWTPQSLARASATACLYSSSCFNFLATKSSVSRDILWLGTGAPPR